MQSELEHLDGMQDKALLIFAVSTPNHARSPRLSVVLAAKSRQHLGKKIYIKITALVPVPKSSKSKQAICIFARTSKNDGTSGWRDFFFTCDLPSGIQREGAWGDGGLKKELWGAAHSSALSNGTKSGSSSNSQSSYF